MKKSRIFLIIGIVLLLAIGGAILYVLTNINSIVKAAIEKYGTQAIRTEVRVSSVNIGLSAGEAAITGLTVANPRGFSTPDIFRLGNISTRIAVKSVTKSPIVIEDIDIKAPEVFYEMTKSGTSNIDTITKALQGPEPAVKRPEKKAKGKEVRLFIRKLVIESGRVEARIAALGERPIMLDLPRIELKDIGKNGGATPTHVAKTVVTALAEQTAKAVAQSEGKKYLKKGAESLLKRYLRK